MTKLPGLSGHMRRTTRALAGVLGVSCWLAGACSSSGGTSKSAPHDAGSRGSTDTDAGGPGSITGMLDGGAFAELAAAWLIGQPDDATHTRVIYVFDRPIKCSEIAKTGWDQTVTDATQSMEMKLIGTKAGKYPIASNGRPATGEADVRYTLTAVRGTPSELVASGGEVTLDRIEEHAAADGAFKVTFAGGELSGKFHAAYCAAGHEP